ncbi:MAG: hypothetical protein V3W34_06735 [Phycisphaerae bacterium]
MSELCKTVAEMRSLSVRALARMYLPDARMFCHCMRRGPDGDQPEGVSRRYTAIVLIGLASEPADTGRGICNGDDPLAVCGRLLSDVDTAEDLGDAALTLWAARLLEHPGASKALDRLRALDPARGPHPTVEVAWALTALSVKAEAPGDPSLAGHIARRLIRSFNHDVGVFPHWPEQVPRPFLRGHVLCFADMVYPVQALSYYHRATGDGEALQTAQRGGQQMVEAQGPEGQWWWHFDARTGRVVEGYPVYAVHQDSMAPMALLALQDACGTDNSVAIERGVRWLMSSVEIGGKSLIDHDADLIWRKVARHEPGKLVRGVQAAVSRLHPKLRASGMDMIFRPGAIDYECRPYHLGWILHAWRSKVESRRSKVKSRGSPASDL